MPYADETAKDKPAVSRNELVQLIGENFSTVDTTANFIGSLEKVGGGASGDYYRLPQQLRLNESETVRLGLKLGNRASPELEREFKREADIAAEINRLFEDPKNNTAYFCDPHSLPGAARPMRIFLDGTIADGRPYMVTEFLPGTPLDELMRENNGGLENAHAIGFSLALHELAILESGRYDKDFQPRNFYVGEDGVVRRCDLGMVFHRGNTELEKEHRVTLIDGGGVFSALARLEGKDYSDRFVQGKLLRSEDLPTQVGIALLRDSGPQPESSEHLFQAAVYGSYADQVVGKTLELFPTQAYELVTAEIRHLKPMLDAINSPLEASDLPGTIGACTRRTAFAIFLKELEQRGQVAFDEAQKLVDSPQIQRIQDSALVAHTTLLADLARQNDLAIESMLGGGRAKSNMRTIGALAAGRDWGASLAICKELNESMGGAASEKYLLRHVFTGEPFDFETLVLLRYQTKFSLGGREFSNEANIFGKDQPVSSHEVVITSEGLLYKGKKLDLTDESRFLPVLYGATKTFLNLSLKTDLTHEELADAKASLLLMRKLQPHAKELDKLAILLDLSSRAGTDGRLQEGALLDICFDDGYLQSQERALADVEKALTGGKSVVTLVQENAELQLRVVELEGRLSAEPVTKSVQPLVEEGAPSYERADLKARLGEAERQLQSLGQESSRLGSENQVLRQQMAEQGKLVDELRQKEATMVAQLLQVTQERDGLLLKNTQLAEQARQEQVRLAQENAQLKARLAEAERTRTTAPAERVVNVDELTLAEKARRAEAFHKRVAEVLGITPKTVNAEVVKILTAKPEVELDEAVRVARINTLVARGLNVVVPGQPAYPERDFARFAGAVGLSKLKAENPREYSRTVDALTRGGIGIVDHDWLNPGDDRWY